MPDEDRDRFTKLYCGNYGRVLGYGMRRASPDVARDAADEVFLVAWRRLRDVPEPALPWLLGVARNIINSQHRSGRRADSLAAEVGRLQKNMRGEDVSEAVVERLTVLQAVASLSDNDRDILMITVWDGLTPQEASKLAGCSTGTFNVRLHRARQRLRAALSRPNSYASARPAVTVVESPTKEIR